MNRRVGGILLLGAVGRAPLTAVGPLVAEIRASEHLSGAAAGLLTTLPLLAFAGFSPVAPLVARRIGLERALGLAVAVLATGIAVRSTPVPVALWLGTAAVGAAIAGFNVLLPSLVKRDHPTRVAQLSGGYSATQSVVAAVASGTAVPLAALTGGWRAGLACWVAVVAVTAVAWLPRVIRPAPEPSPVAATDAPDAVRPVAVGGSASRTPAAAKTHSATITAPTAGPRPPWRTALAWQLTAFMGLQSMAFYVLITWLPSLERDHGIPAQAAGWHLFAYLAAAVAANLVTPVALHRMPDQRLVGLVGVACIGFGTAGLQWLPWTAAWALVSIVVTGFGAGGILVVCLSLFSLRTTDHAQAAALSGMAQTGGYALAAVGPVLFGALRDGSGSWTLPIAVLCALTAVMAVFAVLSGRNRLVG
ncbi:MFS transporter [Dactylosporangium siamense]|uniref:MFS transporter n=1 Tax=Dactylosporangium siamense TaxID=685454 RepID=A0A919PTL5_9ACTN|nr:MFS transporter [Dactylosporangium siamense]GIG50610.1 MFS transporter [Dactylosporangium siamense]